MWIMIHICPFWVRLVAGLQCLRVTDCAEAVYAYVK